MPDTEPKSFSIKYPTRELQTPAEWKGWMSRHLNELGDLADNAALLMNYFSEGRKYILDKFARVRPTPPLIGVAVTEPTTSALIGCSNRGQAIWVRFDYLKEMATLNPGEEYEQYAHDGSLFFDGIVSDSFKLAGVEETHHSVYFQLKGDRASQAADATMLTLPAYDARDVEYHALRWQIRYAREMNMPALTQIRLQTRRWAAIHHKNTHSTSGEQ